MPRRSFQFYAELVLVTILSLVAANAWVRWMIQSLDRFFPGSLKVDFIVAVVMTIVAVWVLHMIFSDKEYPGHVHSGGSHRHTGGGGGGHSEGGEKDEKDERKEEYGAYDAGPHSNGIDRRPEVRHVLYASEGYWE